MGDGKVALILDVLGLAKRAGVISEVRDRALAEARRRIGQETPQIMQSFMLFAGPDDARMALPLGMLARLEEFPASQIEKSGADWVAQYRGQILSARFAWPCAGRTAPPAAALRTAPQSARIRFKCSF